jgi:hypothetical protein
MPFACRHRGLDQQQLIRLCASDARGRVGKGKPSSSGNVSGGDPSDRVARVSLNGQPSVRVGYVEICGQCGGVRGDSERMNTLGIDIEGFPGASQSLLVETALNQSRRAQLR